MLFERLLSLQNFCTRDQVAKVRSRCIQSKKKYRDIRSISDSNVAGCFFASFCVFLI